MCVRASLERNDAVSRRLLTYVGVRRSRFPATKNYVREADRCVFGKPVRTVPTRENRVITPTTADAAIDERFVLQVDVTYAT